MNSHASMPPEISIIVPVYNVERYLPQCIDSILNQTFRDIEVILVDDGSPDRSGAICDEYTARDQRIKVLHRPNAGVSAARNAGIAAASAPFIGFVDSDDWIAPEMYERMYNAMQTTGADIAVCNIAYAFKNIDHLSRYSIKKEECLTRDEALRLLVEDKTLQNYLCDKLFRKSLLTYELPLNVRFEDVRIMVKWMSNATKIVRIPYVGYYYRQSESSYLHADTHNRYPDYFNAREAQLRFLEEHNLIPDKWQFINNDILEMAVRHARDFARELPVNQELYDDLDSLAQIASGYIEPSHQLISKKFRKRLDMLLNNKKQFIFKMKIGGLFHKLMRHKSAESKRIPFD